MNEDILESIFQSEESTEAANAVKEALDEMDGESKELFKGKVLEHVTETFPDAYYHAKWGWNYIDIPIHKKYDLWVNYDLYSVRLALQDGKKHDADLEKTLADKMANFTNAKNETPDIVWESWGSEGLWYKGLADSAEHRIPFEQYKLFKDHPEQAAQEIVQLAQMLEQD
jgi:hypothetical protein